MVKVCVFYDNDNWSPNCTINFLIVNKIWVQSLDNQIGSETPSLNLKPEEQRIKLMLSVMSGNNTYHQHL